MVQARCTSCNQLTEIKKTWTNETIGTFTVCDNCGERIIIENEEVVNARKREGETVFHVDNPRRISKREMRRRLDGYMNNTFREQ